VRILLPEFLREGLGVLEPDWNGLFKLRKHRDAAAPRPTPSPSCPTVSFVISISDLVVQ
jgi:hypothetical protein